MGYYSQWKLAFFGPVDKVRQLLAWMNTIPTPFLIEEQKVMKVILDNEEARQEIMPNTLGISFGHVATKCYPPWENAILKIQAHAEELGVEMAYGELGEDIEDNTFINSENLCIQLSRELLPVEFP